MPRLQRFGKQEGKASASSLLPKQTQTKTSTNTRFEPKIRGGMLMLRVASREHGTQESLERPSTYRATKTSGYNRSAQRLDTLPQTWDS